MQAARLGGIRAQLRIARAVAGAVDALPVSDHLPIGRIVHVRRELAPPPLLLLLLLLLAPHLPLLLLLALAPVLLFLLVLFVLVEPPAELEDLLELALVVVEDLDPVTPLLLLGLEGLALLLR